MPSNTLPSIKIKMLSEFTFDGLTFYNFSQPINNIPRKFIYNPRKPLTFIKEQRQHRPPNTNDNPMEWLGQNHQLKKKNPLGWKYSSVVSLACAFKKKKNPLSQNPRNWWIWNTLFGTHLRKHWPIGPLCWKGRSTIIWSIKWGKPAWAKV